MKVKILPTILLGYSWCWQWLVGRPRHPATNQQTSLPLNGPLLNQQSYPRHSSTCCILSGHNSASSKRTITVSDLANERFDRRELNGEIWWHDNETRTDPINSTFSSYSDPESSNLLHNDTELMRLVQETLQILDLDKRAETSKDMYLRLREESYELGVGYTNIPWAVGPRVLTWEPYPVSLYISAYHNL
jgi:hypothetical protein